MQQPLLGSSKNSLSVDFRANFLFCKETPTTHIRQYIC